MLEIEFSKPDQYNQVLAYLKLDYIQKKLGVITEGGECKSETINVKINGNEFKYTFEYSDAGTMGYAQMQGRQAIGGHMTNLSINWGNKPQKEDFPIIHFCGTLDHRKNTMSLTFFMNWI